nr:hypothetical protein [Thiocapsa sp. KS1]
MRRLGMTFPVAMMSGWLISGAAFAQEPGGQGQAEMPVAPPTVEWAIAPEGRTLPGGIVLEEGMVLPPGTVLPGGAILPGAPAVAAPSATSTPAGVPAPVPAPEQVSAPVQAQPPVPLPDTSTARRLPGQSSLGVPHISGGIGESEREAMEQVKDQYNLRLLFAVAGSGSYLSNIRVEIQDAAGPTLLTTVTVGPWLYANLTPGDYELRVEHAGRLQVRPVRVPPSGASSEAFYWPAL